MATTRLAYGETLIGNGPGSSSNIIDDTQASASTTYSSQKIEQLIADMEGVVPINPASTTGRTVYIVTDDPTESGSGQLSEG